MLFSKTSVYALTALTGLSTAQDYKSWGEASYNQLMTYYDQSTGLWGEAWWTSANALTTIVDLGLLDINIGNDARYIAPNTFNQAQLQSAKVKRTVISAKFGTVGLRPRAATGFLNDFYDDEGWWALAWIATYDLIGDVKYLNMASSIFNDMIGGWDDSRCGGGIWWSKDKTYVNAIANELFMSVAAHLSNRLNGTAETNARSWALKSYNWFRSSGMINNLNLINDGLAFTNSAQTTCANNNETIWSYNQGVILGALVEMSRGGIGSSSDNMELANGIAKSAIYVLNRNNILTESCDPGCTGDGSQFKGVFMRNLQLLQKYAPDPVYKDFIDANAQSVWAYDRDASSNQLDEAWAGGSTNAGDQITQGSAMDAIVAALAVG